MPNGDGEDKKELRIEGDYISKLLNKENERDWDRWRGKQTVLTELIKEDLGKIADNIEDNKKEIANTLKLIQEEIGGIKQEISNIKGKVVGFGTGASFVTTGLVLIIKYIMTGSV